MIGKLFKDESGASVVEYSVILGFIAIVVMVAIAALGQSLSTLYSYFATTVANMDTTGS
jgi:Flp pilus assembly pilin Flp